MPKYTVVGIREETPAEAARREWFEKQALAAPDNLEAAARQIIGLVTALLGVLFGVLALSSGNLPAYMDFLPARILAVGVVVLLLAALGSALFVVLPFKREAASGKPESHSPHVPLRLHPPPRSSPPRTRIPHHPLRPRRTHQAAKDHHLKTYDL